MQVVLPVLRSARCTTTLPAAPPLPGSIDPARSDTAHASRPVDPEPVDPEPADPEPAAPEPADPEPAAPDPVASAPGVAPEVGAVVVGVVGALLDGVSDAVGTGAAVSSDPPDPLAHPLSTSTAAASTPALDTTARVVVRRLRPPLLSPMPPDNHFHGGTAPHVLSDPHRVPAGSGRIGSVLVDDDGPTRKDRPMAAGKHEAARGDEDRADGVDERAGEFVDSEIPGDRRVTDDEPVGEFVSSDIPGERRPESEGEEGEYVESDIPGDAEPAGPEATGHYTDRDQ